MQRCIRRDVSNGSGIVYDTILKDPTMRAFRMPYTLIVADLAVF